MEISNRVEVDQAFDQIKSLIVSLKGDVVISSEVDLEAVVINITITQIIRNTTLINKIKVVFGDWDNSVWGDVEAYYY